MYRPLSPPWNPAIPRPALVGLGLAALLLAVPATAQPWSQTFGGPGADLAFDVAPAVDGGAFAVGFTNTDLLIEGYVVKTDADGELVWERSLSLSPLAETFYSVLPTASGGVVVAGSADDPDQPNYRPWLLELDAAGNTVWSSEDAYTADLPVDSGLIRAVRLGDGRYAVIGGANSMTNPEQPWVLITDAVGDQVSFQQFGTLGTPGFGVATYVNNLEATADGGFIATGTVSGGLGFAYLWKFDAQGQPEWDRLYGADGFREGFSVRQLADGGYLATGCDLPNCNNTVVLRTDAAGAVTWRRLLDDPADRRSFGRDVLELPGGDLLLLQTLDAAAGSRVIETELLTLTAGGQTIVVEPIQVGEVTTAGYRLSRSGTGDLWLGGYANDTSDPVAIDLMLVLLEDSGRDAMIFQDGFEGGDWVRWSMARQ